MEGLVPQVAAAAEVAAGAVAAGVSTEDETARPADAEDNEAPLEGDSSATLGLAILSFRSRPHCIAFLSR